MDMKRLTVVLGVVALTFAMGCSNKKKECEDACAKSLEAGEATCKSQAGPAADACSQAVKQTNDQCKATCENL